MCHSPYDCCHCWKISVPTPCPSLSFAFWIWTMSEPWSPHHRQDNLPSLPSSQGIRTSCQSDDSAQCRRCRVDTRLPPLSFPRIAARHPRGAKPCGDKLPGFFELSAQVGTDLLMSEVIIPCPVDSKILVIGDQFKEGPEVLGCGYFFLIFIRIFPYIDSEQLQGVLWRQRSPQLLLTLRRERQ